MTKRELNKLPAGGLRVNVLRHMGAQELTRVAVHCFEKWKLFQSRCKQNNAVYRREIDDAEDYLFDLRRETFQKGLGWNMCKNELKAAQAEISALCIANEKFQAEISALRITINRLSKSKPKAAELEAMRQATAAAEEEAKRLQGLNNIYISYMMEMNELEDANTQLNDEVQWLKQHLATHLVPVPGNPGMAFISYPN